MRNSLLNPRAKFLSSPLRRMGAARSSCPRKVILGRPTEQAGGPGQQGEAAQQLNRQAEIGQRSTADASPVQGQTAAQNLIMNPPDRLEQPQVRPAQALL